MRQCGHLEQDGLAGRCFAVVRMYTETRGPSGRRGNLEFAAEAADSGAERCSIGSRNGPCRIPKPVEIILVGGVTAEINYVRDEIPRLQEYCDN